MHNVNGKTSNIKLVPILPNLITSTDEMSFFASNQPVNGKERLFITAKPKLVKGEVISSGRRNNYQKNLIG